VASKLQSTPRLFTSRSELLMLILLRFWAFAAMVPRCFRGADLHRAALQSAAAGDRALADRLFEAAAARYREDLSVPELARLRVHQLMVRAEEAIGDDHDAAFELTPEIERRLLALDHIEDLDPPFADVRAEDLLASWSMRFRGAARPQAA